MQSRIHKINLNEINFKKSPYKHIYVFISLKKIQNFVYLLNKDIKRDFIEISKILH